MKQLITILLALCMTLSFTACSGTSSPSQSTEKKAESSVSSSSDEGKKAEFLDQETFEALSAQQIADEIMSGKDTTADDILSLYAYNTYGTLSTHSGVFFSPTNLSDAIAILTDEYGIPLPDPIDVIETYISSEKRELRLFALGTFIDLDSDTEIPESLQNKMIEIIQSDPDELVRGNAVKACTYVCFDYDNIYQACLKAAQDPSAFVRSALSENLTWNDSMDGAEDTLMSLLNDEDPSVRAYTGEAMGIIGNPAVIPVMQDLLEDPALSNYHFQAVCALMEFWTDYEPHDESEEAYRICLSYLQSEKPEPIAFSNILYFFDNGVDEEWLSYSPWFDVEELKTVLTSIVENSSIDESCLETAADYLERLN